MTRLNHTKLSYMNFGRDFVVDQSLTTFGVILIVRAGVKIEKIPMLPFGKQLEKIIIVARCKFLDTSLCNVNDAAHSMALSIKFDF